MATEVVIEAVESLPSPAWLELRRELWPDCSDGEHEAETASFLAEPRRYGQFLAFTGERVPLGFVEVSVRTDHVNGTESSPVGFVEGLYVRPAARGRGVARALVTAAAGWAIRHGCRELASDVLLENRLSQAVHLALGFEETERVVYFRMTLDSLGIDHG